MFPPKPSDMFSPEGGCSEGLDAFRFFLNNNVNYYIAAGSPALHYLLPGTGYCIIIIGIFFDF